MVSVVLSNHRIFSDQYFSRTLSRVFAEKKEVFAHDGYSLVVVRHQVVIRSQVIERAGDEVGCPSDVVVVGCHADRDVGHRFIPGFAGSAGC